MESNLNNDFKISGELFRAFLDCPYKAFLRRIQVPSAPTEYIEMRMGDELAARRIFLARLFLAGASDRNLSPSEVESAMQSGSSPLVRVEVAHERCMATIDAIEKVKGKSSLGSFHYQPLLTISTPAASSKDKTLLGFYGHILSSLQGRPPLFGKIVPTGDRKTQTVRMPKLISRAKKHLQLFLAQKSEPVLMLNRHCKACEYQVYCRKRAQEKDDLSLFSGMGAKEVESLNRRGIFTVTQLSHKFRPQRRHKGIDFRRRPHLFSLHALAVREGKVHIYNCPPIPKAPTEIFLDVESDPDREFYYLIGLRIVGKMDSVEHQFWASTPSEEVSIFERFLQVVDKIPEFKLYHFGSFESRFIKTMAKRMDLEERSIIKKIIDNSVNVLNYIYPAIYFPTYSNDLKSLAAYLGFKWRSADASGLQSIVWRRRWDEGGDQKYKDLLLEYNADDCSALQVVMKFIDGIDVSDPARTERDRAPIVDADAIENKMPVRWGSINFVLPEMEKINDCAYYDYQRDRVYFRDKRKRSNRSTSKRILRPRRFERVNRTIDITCRKCPKCKSERIDSGSKCSRLVVDLKFFRNGVKRWIDRLVSRPYWCLECKHRFISSRYRPASRQRMRITYAHGLQSWMLYQFLVYNQSLRDIAETLAELFGIGIAPAQLVEFKSELSRKYQPTYQQIKKEVLNSDILVVDEAKMKLGDAVGYAWVFANSKSVLFVYKENREGDFLHEFLKDFKGVLVSDFYAAYDSIPCPQQRCLIHLMRDLNEDVTKNPFDEELKTITRGFTEILRATVETIDRYGLKKRRLTRHRDAAQKFLENVINATYSSEAAKKYQKRFAKNRDRLFTFMNYDGVPWNNNSAEHAIKHLARLRKRGMTSYKRARIDEYMELISIYQTCEYRDISFLRFLLSGDTRLE